jgi:hypothetical protein
MIDMFTIAYIHGGERDTIAVYAYPSGGIGITGTDPMLTNALGGTRALVDVADPMEAQQGAQRLADVLAYLTGGEVSYSAIDRR